MSILFINGSPNKNGNTAKLAAKLLTGKEYETLELVDYKLYAYGQKFEDDQFSEILEKMKEADTIVIGSPVYWHNMCRSSEKPSGPFLRPCELRRIVRKKIRFYIPGAAPELWMLEKAEYTMSRFAKMYGMEYAGMVTNEREAEKVSEKLGR